MLAAVALLRPTIERLALRGVRGGLRGSRLRRSSLRRFGQRASGPLDDGQHAPDHHRPSGGGAARGTGPRRSARGVGPAPRARRRRHRRRPALPACVPGWRAGSRVSIGRGSRSRGDGTPASTAVVRFGLAPPVADDGGAPGWLLGLRCAAGSAPPRSRPRVALVTSTYSARGWASIQRSRATAPTRPRPRRSVLRVTASCALAAVGRALPGDLALTYGLFDARGYDFPIERRYHRIWGALVNPAQDSFAGLSGPMFVPSGHPRDHSRAQLLRGCRHSRRPDEPATELERPHCGVPWPRRHCLCQSRSVAAHVRGCRAEGRRRRGCRLRRGSAPGLRPSTNGHPRGCRSACPSRSTSRACPSTRVRGRQRRHHRLGVPSSNGRSLGRMVPRVEGHRRR